MAKIKIIVENTAFQTLVKAEHGLSILIENNIGEKLLFDTGQTSTIIHNLEIYNQKPEEINAIALSHGHYDHSGGLPHVLSRNHSANVYAKRECLLDKRRIDGSYIGAPQLSDNQKNRLVFIDEPT